MTIRCMSRNLAMAAAIGSAFAAAGRADEITDWNQNLLLAAQTAVTSPLVMTRNAAIVQGAVFDALNGIERHYAPLHVNPAAPPGASRRAAIVQAAYASLLKLYPSQQASLDAKRLASLNAIASDSAAENSVSIARGIAWGQTVADAIWAWRSADGIAAMFPPYLGGAGAGQWRPTPPAFAPGAGLQFAYMTPWVMTSPSQFRPLGPPALTSARYTEEFNEVKIMGSATSASRTPDQTSYSQFWASTNGNYLWNVPALSLADQHNLTLSAKSRMLALLNLAMADAGIGCWDAKYVYSFWRPVTAIREADADGNPATIADPAWTPLIVTPAHPDYLSGHSCASSAAANVLASYFGENATFSVVSDVMPGVVRSFTSFSSALAEVANAHIFGGIHYRAACDAGLALGASVGEYVRAHALQRVNGQHKD